jgi:LacI family transcriptional regulator
MITLKDVAKEVGLNFRSVSRVLHKDDPRYSQATRQRIREAAERLGYRPNAVARAMKKGKTHSIGVSGHFNSSALNVEILHITARELNRMGSKMFFIAHETGRPDEEKAGIEDLLDRRVEGMLIFANTTNCETAYYETLWERGTPLVVAGRFSTPQKIPVVSVDVMTGMYAATKHLIGLGHRHIAYPVGSFGMAMPWHRFHGFKRALEEAGIPVRRDWLMADTLSNCDATL